MGSWEANCLAVYFALAAIFAVEAFVRIRRYTNDNVVIVVLESCVHGAIWPVLVVLYLLDA